MKREHSLYLKCTCDQTEKIYDNGYSEGDFHYYKKSFIENRTLDDLFDFE